MSLDSTLDTGGYTWKPKPESPRPFPPIQQSNVSEAQLIAGRLTEMISQVLDVSRMESGQMPLSLKETDLNALLPAAVTSLGPAPSEITVAYQLPAEPVTIACDPDLISRVVVNLVGNAFKFTPRAGRMSVGLMREADRVRITVSDTGPGIPPEFRGKVFEKFGLGLTFCKLAVEAHRGRIGLEGAEGGGARFWIELFGKPAGG